MRPSEQPAHEGTTPLPAHAPPPHTHTHPQPHTHTTPSGAAGLVSLDWNPAGTGPAAAGSRACGDHAAGSQRPPGYYRPGGAAVSAPPARRTCLWDAVSAPADDTGLSGPASWGAAALLPAEPCGTGPDVGRAPTGRDGKIWALSGCASTGRRITLWHLCPALVTAGPGGWPWVYSIMLEQLKCPKNSRQVSHGATFRGTSDGNPAWWVIPHFPQLLHSELKVDYMSILSQCEEGLQPLCLPLSRP